MTKKDRAKIKRIEKALATIDEVLIDLFKVMPFDARCDLRQGQTALKLAIIKIERGEYGSV